MSNISLKLIVLKVEPLSYLSITKSNINWYFSMIGILYPRDDYKCMNRESYLSSETRESQSYYRYIYHYNKYLVIFNN